MYKRQGTGFTREHRRDYWERREVLIGSEIKVLYQTLTTGKKVPRFPVYKEIIEND